MAYNAGRYAQGYFGTPSVMQGLVTDRQHYPALWDKRHYNVKVNDTWFENGISADNYQVAMPAVCVTLTYGPHSRYVTDFTIC